MKRILIKLNYEITASDLKNRLYNNSDYVLAFLYLLISVYNAKNCVYNIELFDQQGNIIIDSLTTMLIIFMNIVILFRVGIKLHIQFIDEERNAILNLEKNVRYDRIIIEALEKRLFLLRSVWLICIVIIIFVWFYGNAVVKSVGAMATVCAGLTFFNDIIDIAINKYSAKIRVGTMKYINRR